MSTMTAPRDNVDRSNAVVLIDGCHAARLPSRSARHNDLSDLDLGLLPLIRTINPDNGRIGGDGDGTP